MNYGGQLIPIYDPVDVTPVNGTIYDSIDQSSGRTFTNGQLLGYVLLGKNGNAIATFNSDEFDKAERMTISKSLDRVTSRDLHNAYKAVIGYDCMCDDCLFDRGKATKKRGTKTPKPTEPVKTVKTVKTVKPDDFPFKFCTPDWDFNSAVTQDGYSGYYKVECGCGEYKTGGGGCKTKASAWNAFMQHKFGDAWEKERAKLDQLWEDCFPAEPRPKHTVSSGVVSIVSGIGSGLWNAGKAVRHPSYGMGNVMVVLAFVIFWTAFWICYFMIFK